MKAEFVVGKWERVTIEVSCSSWTGLQVYKVDGQVVQKFRSFKLNDVIEFTAGKLEKHKIKIVLKTFPPTTQVYVDGELYLTPLFGDHLFSIKDAMKRNETHALKWERKLKKGRLKYLLTYSIYWGVPVAMGQSAMILYSSKIQVDISSVFIVNLLLWPALFIFVGMGEWQSIKKNTKIINPVYAAPREQIELGGRQCLTIQ